MLDFIVDNFLPIVREFREELQELEQDIFAETYKRDTIRSLYDMQARTADAAAGGRAAAGHPESADAPASRA